MYEQTMTQHAQKHTFRAAAITAATAAAAETTKAVAATANNNKTPAHKAL